MSRSELRLDAATYTARSEAEAADVAARARDAGFGTRTIRLDSRFTVVVVIPPPVR